MVQLQVIVQEQAKDEGLWFVAETAPEAYLQKALRRLHEAIEGKTAKECAIESLQKMKFQEGIYNDNDL